MPSKKRTYISKKPRWTKTQVNLLKNMYSVISLEKISKQIDKSISAIKYKAMSIGLKYKYKKGQTEEDIKNKINKSKIKIIDEYTGDIQSKFKCPYCNNIFLALPSHIFSNQIKSCGCLTDKSNTHLIKGTKEVPKTYFTRLQKGAIDRNLEFNIDINYISKLLIEQDFKCALTGLDIKLGYPARKKENCTASLDRIDSSKGYIKNNVQWVHKDINWMKYNFSMDKFILYCRLIIEKYEKNKLDMSNK